jgi:diaminobutyrate acetyltransferase
MATGDGVKLIEYNFRPGDPEWMNTMAVLKGSLLDAVVELLAGHQTALEFKDQATVCKYIVPESYPQELNQDLDVELDLEAIRDLEVGLYYSCGVNDGGRLNVGSERGIAFIAAADSVERAHERVEKAIASVSGTFFHRPDIGTSELLESKVDHVARLRADALSLRTAREEEFLDLQGFVAGCPPLEAYPQHVYKILLRYFGSCSFVAERGDRMVGFVMGMPSHRHPGTWFLWQIGVAADQQGTGLGKRLLRHVEAEIGRLGFDRIEVTVDPMNAPSRRLFEALGYTNISSREGSTLEVNGHPAVKDYYRPGRHFMVFENKLADDG